MKIPNPFARDKEGEQDKKEKSFARESQMVDASLSPHNEDEKIMMEQREKYADLRRWQQDRSGVNKQLFLRLSGMVLDANGELKEDTSFKAITNVIGARRLIDFIEVLDVNVMMANWDKDYMRNILMINGKALRQHLMAKTEVGDYNYNVYGIQKQNIKYVYWLIYNTFEATYQRGWNNGERNLDSKISKQIDTHHHSDEEKKKSLFSV